MYALARPIIAASVVLGAVLGFAGTVSAEGEGHTPTVVCHWVPAHGGTFVKIVVDDDAASDGRGHDGHDEDTINPFRGICFRD